MKVKSGVPDDSYSNDGGSSNEGVLANTGVGDSAGKQWAGALEDKECFDEDDDEDDIPLPMMSTWCAWDPTPAAKEIF